jgi:arginine exporter protein ArgO
VTDALISGLLAGYGVAIPVGAIGVLLISLSARTNLGVGAGAALGVAAADAIYAAIAVIGGTAIAGVIRPAATPLRVVAAIVLLAIAVRVAVTAWRHKRDPTRAVKTPALTSGPRAFLALLALTMLNPATVIYFAALVLGQKSGGVTDGAAASTAWVVAVGFASASWQLALAVGGSALGRTLSSDRGRLATALASSLLIFVLAIRTLWS